MKEFEAILSQKNQVTISKEIRSRLDLKPGDKIAFELENDVVRFRHAPSRISKWHGSITPKQKPEDFRKIRDEFEEGVAEEVNPS